MILLDHDFRAALDVLQYGVYVARQLGFGDAQDCHTFDHTSSSCSTSNAFCISRLSRAGFSLINNSGQVRRAMSLLERADRDVRVDLRGLQIGVAEHRLNESDEGTRT